MVETRVYSVFNVELPLRDISAIGVGMFGVGAAVGGYGAYVALLLNRGVAPEIAGVGMSLFLLSQLAGAVPADRFSRTTSIRGVLTVGLLLCACGAILASSPTLVGALASRVFLGFGQGAAFLAGMKYVGTRTDQKNTATAQGLLGAFFTFGFAAGLAFAPELVNTLGPAIPAIVDAGIILGGAVGASSVQPVRSGNSVSISRYVSGFTAPGLALGLGNMASFGFLMVAATWYTNVLTSYTALPVTPTLVAFALSTVVGRGLGGRLSRTIGETKTVVGSLVGLAILLEGVQIALMTESTILLAICLVGTGLGFGAPFGPLFGLAFSQQPTDVGITLVGMIAVTNLGALAYPWLVGRILSETSSYQASFVVMSVSVVVVLVIFYASFNHSPDDQSPVLAEDQ